MNIEEAEKLSNAIYQGPKWPHSMDIKWDDDTQRTINLHTHGGIGAQRRLEVKELAQEVLERVLQPDEIIIREPFHETTPRVRGR